MLDLELISEFKFPSVQLPPPARPAIVINPEVSLYGSGQVRSVVPQNTPTDAHTRREEVPQIPLSDVCRCRGGTDRR